MLRNARIARGPPGPGCGGRISTSGAAKLSAGRCWRYMSGCRKGCGTDYVWGPRGSRVAGCRFRDVAQSGSAPEWGSGGRGFKSRRPDLKERPLAAPSSFRAAGALAASLRDSATKSRRPDSKGRAPDRAFVVSGRRRLGCVAPRLRAQIQLRTRRLLRIFRHDRRRADVNIERLNTALGANYRVERELGGGGMSRALVRLHHRCMRSAPTSRRCSQTSS